MLHANRAPAPARSDVTSRRQPFPVAQWLNAVYCHPDRPPAAQRDILSALAVKYLDWRSGEGFASIEMLADFCGAARSTVQRALRWARAAELLVLTRRGHRLGNGKTIASEWRLSLPQGVNRLSVEKPLKASAVTC